VVNRKTGLDQPDQQEWEMGCLRQKQKPRPERQERQDDRYGNSKGEAQHKSEQDHSTQIMRESIG
jgi:hypothetical protein